MPRQWHLRWLFAGVVRPIREQSRPAEGGGGRAPFGYRLSLVSPGARDNFVSLETEVREGGRQDGCC